MAHAAEYVAYRLGQIDNKLGRLVTLLEAFVGEGKPSARAGSDLPAGSTSSSSCTFAQQIFACSALLRLLDVDVDQAGDVAVVGLLLEDDIVLRRGIGGSALLAGRFDLDLRLLGGAADLRSGSGSTGSAA